MLRMLRRVRNGYRGKTRAVGGGDDGDNDEEGERRIRRLASSRRLPLLPMMPRGWGGLLGPARDGKGQWYAGAFVGAIGALVLCAGARRLSGNVHGRPSVLEVSSFGGKCPVSEKGAGV